MATDTKKQNQTPKGEVPKNVGENAANIDPVKQAQQHENQEYVMHQLAEKAGQRIRGLALTIKASPELRKEIEELAHDIEGSVPRIAAKARTEDALITQIEAAVDKAEHYIQSAAKEEEKKEKKAEEKSKEKEHKIHPHSGEKPASAEKTIEERSKEKLNLLRAEIQGDVEAKETIAQADTDRAAKSAALTESIQNLKTEGDQHLAEAERLGKVLEASKRLKEKAQPNAKTGISDEEAMKRSESAVRLEELRKEMQQGGGRNHTQPPLTGAQKERSGANKEIITNEEAIARFHEATREQKKNEHLANMRQNAPSIAERRERIKKLSRGGGPAQRPQLRVQTPGTTRPPAPAQPKLGVQTKIKGRAVAATGTGAAAGTAIPGKIKMGSLAGRLAAGRDVYRNIEQDTETTDTITTINQGYIPTEDEFEFESGSETTDSSSDDNQNDSSGGQEDQNRNRQHRRMRIPRRGFGGPKNPASNIVRGGLGGGAKAGAKVAVKAGGQVAARGLAALLTNPIGLLITVGIIAAIFVIWFLFLRAGAEDNTCQAPAETMKVTVTGPAEAAAGQTLPYQITVTDTVPNQEVTIVATIPQGMSTVPTDITSSWTRFALNGNTITWKATENLPPNSLNPPNINFTVTLKALAPSTNAVIKVDATPSRAAAAPPAQGGGGPAGNQKSTEELMKIYGSTQAEVETQLVTIDFQGKQIQVHKKVQGVFEKVNSEITAANTGYQFRSVGSFSWRQKNCPGGCSGLSTHSFGITVDINPDTNPYTTANTHDIPPAVSDIFKRNGFIWGGDWNGAKDWMHFEYAGEPGAVAPGAPGAPGAGGTNCPPAGGGGPISGNYVPPSDDACGGKYTKDIKRNYLLPKNFGDPQCNFSEDALRTLLMQLENNNEEFVNFWYVTIVPHESGFNPNAWNAPDDASQAGLDPQGAWGLYQKGSSKPPGSPPPAGGLGGPLDRGDVNWETQTKNAIEANRAAGCDFWYYGTYRKAVKQRIDRC
jgi:hypothetical protein